MPFFSNVLSAIRGLFGDMSAQDRLPCSTIEAHREAIEADSGYRARFTNYERRMRQWMQMPPLATPVFKVPVIVHFVGDGHTPKCSEEKAREQIRILNQCFAQRNTTSAVPAKWTNRIGNPQLEFFLPETGPDGKKVKAVRCRTTTRKGFQKETAEDVKAVSPPEDTNRFLNVWVCNFASNGLATFPTEPAGATQGIIVHYQCFAESSDSLFGKGYTLVHEVGHWLGLFHLWGDHEKPPSGDDEVMDTPVQCEEHSGDAGHPCGCDSRAAAEADHMFMNFMDYTPDTIRCFFTEEQAARMRAALVKERPGILWATTP